MTKLVYIGGYGHSGSTLLEYLLAASPEAVACGEVASVLRDRDRKGKCTCRRPIRECPVWGPLFASPDTLDGMSHEDLSRAFSRKAGRACHPDRLDQDSLALGRRPVSPCQCAWGRLHARASGARPARRRLVWGEEGRQARRPPAAAAALGSAALGWWIANLACELFGSKYPDRYVRLRYEDLARAPGDEMQGLFAKLVPGSEWPAEAIGGCDNRHQLYGNRMRAANLSLAEVREDAAWQRDMPRLYRSLVSLLTAPLRWRTAS